MKELEIRLVDKYGYVERILIPLIGRRAIIHLSDLKLLLNKITEYNVKILVYEVKIDSIHRCPLSPVCRFKENCKMINNYTYCLKFIKIKDKLEESGE